MPRTSSKPGTMIDRFSYTPGDGHRYAWRGDVIVVERIGTDEVTGRLTFTPTGDTLPVPKIQTATAFMAAVDQWHLAGTDWRTPSQRLMP